MPTFTGRTDGIRCKFPGCGDVGLHRHHITYDPPVIENLCERHHEDITIINLQQAGKIRGALSNKHRWRNWYCWLRGELRPRRTAKAMEYIEEMRRGPR
jgi:hypothetical protein